VTLGTASGQQHASTPSRLRTVATCYITANFNMLQHQMGTEQTSGVTQLQEVCCTHMYHQHSP
jgi:hypothetical protein